MLFILNTPLLHEYKLLSELKVMSASKNVPSQTFWDGLLEAWLALTVWLRGIKMYWFPWYLTLVSTNHASSNLGLKINYLSVFTGLLKLKTILQEMRIYSRTSTNDHLSTTANSLQRPLFFWADSPYIDSCLSLATTATFCCPQSGRCISSPVAGGGELLPYKGLMGMCSQSGMFFGILS